MTEELEVRFMVESVEGTYCVCGYIVDGDNIVFTEGDGIVHTIPIDKVSRVVQETVTRQDVTNKVKNLTLV